MSTNLKRVMISLPNEMLHPLDEIKKETFYNNTSSEMYRHLLWLGIEAEKAKVIKDNQHPKQPA